MPLALEPKTIASGTMTGTNSGLNSPNATQDGKVRGYNELMDDYSLH